MARENQPSVVFVDEIDSFNALHEGFKRLQEIQLEIVKQIEIGEREKAHVVVVAASSAPWKISANLKRK